MLAYWWRQRHGRIKKYDVVFGADGAFFKFVKNAKNMFNYS
jgi:hypothetical protein